MAATDVVAAEICLFDPIENALRCTEVGGGAVDPPPDDGGSGDSQLRYLFTSTDAGVGDCYYWSATPGGLDAWDGADDAAIIAITTTLPVCPATPVSDPAVRGWEVFRSWDLASPDPHVTPGTAGITGLRSHIGAIEPAWITHAEVLPDGRPLDVRARTTALIVDWGDGTTTHHLPGGADGYPDGDVHHVYTLKTCTAQYRANHPSGSLCHPSLEHYTITALYVWTGEFDVGSGWIELGTIDTTATITYDVDEAIGVTVPSDEGG